MSIGEIQPLKWDHLRIVPEGKDSTAPWLFVASLRMNTPRMETPTLLQGDLERRFLTLQIEIPDYRGGSQEERDLIRDKGG